MVVLVVMVHKRIDKIHITVGTWVAMPALWLWCLAEKTIGTDNVAYCNIKRRTLLDVV
jgi:hypothetical protein